MIPTPHYRHYGLRSLRQHRRVVDRVDPPTVKDHVGIGHGAGSVPSNESAHTVDSGSSLPSSNTVCFSKSIDFMKVLARQLDIVKVVSLPVFEVGFLEMSHHFTQGRYVGLSRLRATKQRGSTRSKLKA